MGPLRRWKQSYQAQGEEREPDRRFRRLAIAEIERQRIERALLAGRLHDHVAQDLSGAGLQLDLLRMDLEQSVPGLGGRTGEIQALLDRVVTQIRQLSYDLHPNIAERAGLRSALDQLSGRYRSEFDGALRLMFDSSAQVSTRASSAMEKIADEAVRNAVRHSGCSRVEVLVKAVPGGASLEVRDDGRGFDLDRERKEPSGLGLSLMEHWSEQAGLRLTLETGARGTALTAHALGENTQF